MRLIQIDILRCLAIFLVLAAHLGGGGGRNPGISAFLARVYSRNNDWNHSLESLMRPVMRAGWIGVDLFFVLSGFLISGLLFQEHKRSGKIRIGRFLIRRGFKIYPAFYVMLLATVGIIGWTGVHPVSASQFWSEALFLTNYCPNIWGHTWSLAVEEHFYVLMPLSLLTLLKWRGGRPFDCLPLCFAIVALLELTLRIGTSLAEPEFSHKTHLFPTHLRLDSLFFGTLLAYYHHYDIPKIERIWRHPVLVLIACGLLISPALVLDQDNFWIRTVGLSGLYLGFGGILVVFLSVSPNEHRWLSPIGRLLAYIGRHSYSVYLWHVPVIAVGVGLIGRMTGRKLGVFYEISGYLLGSILIGVAMARLVEMPALRVRDRFFPPAEPATPPDRGSDRTR